jgi:hypothetical protein
MFIHIIIITTTSTPTTAAITTKKMAKDAIEPCAHNLAFRMCDAFVLLSVSSNDRVGGKVCRMQM